MKPLESFHLTASIKRPPVMSVILDQFIHTLVESGLMTKNVF